MRLYVYYRCSAAELQLTTDIARAMQSALRSLHPDVQPELLRRPELRDGEATLMEIYAGAGVDAEFELTLERAARQVALPQPRHVERFVDA